MSRINTRTAAAAFGAGLLLSALATAQPVFAAEPVVQSVEHIRPDGPPIRLSLASGTLIRLPKGARTAFIADPAIADIQITSPTTILLYAKKGGDTVLYAEGGEDDVLLNTIVRVRPLEVQVMRPEKDKGTKETSSTTRQATTITSRAGGVTTSTTKSTTEIGPTE